MNGWTRAGEVLKCASCGAVIERMENLMIDRPGIEPGIQIDGISCGDSAGGNVFQGQVVEECHIPDPGFFEEGRRQDLQTPEKFIRQGADTNLIRQIAADVIIAGADLPHPDLDFPETVFIPGFGFLFLRSFRRFRRERITLERRLG